MKVEAYIENLKLTYNNKNLPHDIKKEAIEIYKQNIPSYFDINGAKCPIVTFNYILIAEGYSQIIFDDYGAFIRVEEEDICWDNFKPKTVQLKNDIIIYEIDNYPNFECKYMKYNNETKENSYMLIPIYKIFPVK